MDSLKLRHFIIPVIIAVAVFSIFLATRRPSDSNDNEAEYKLYDGQTVSLVVGSRLLTPNYPPIIRDNEIALDLDTVKSHIDNTVHWDAANGKVTITTRDRLVRMNTDNLTAYVNDRDEVKLDLPVFEEDGVVYLPMKFLSEFFEIRISYNEKNKVVIVDDRKAIVQTASIVEEGAVIRLGRSVDQPIVKKYTKKIAGSGNAEKSGAGDGGARRTGVRRRRVWRALRGGGRPLLQLGLCAYG